MRNKCGFAASLLVVLLFGAVAWTIARPMYKAAEVVATDDFQPPWNSIASGTVVLDVSLDATGAVGGVTVLRDVPSLTNAAESAVQSWQFEPAIAAGGPRPSNLLAIFVVSAAVNFPSDPSFASLQPEASTSGYVLPGIVSVSYPHYPVNSVVSGSVVVQVAVGPDGNAAGWQIVRGLDPCTRFAMEAAKKWHFRAAILDGQPVASKIAIDFVFRPPL
jgi:TonB family protein